MASGVDRDWSECKDRQLWVEIGDLHDKMIREINLRRSKHKLDKRVDDLYTSQSVKLQLFRSMSMGKRIVLDRYHYL